MMLPGVARAGSNASVCLFRSRAGSFTESVVHCITSGGRGRHPFRDLFWSANDSEVEKLALRGITPDDIYEAVFGVEGEDSTALIRRIEQPNVGVYGQTGSGRLLKVVGEDMQDGTLRVFHAIDMNEAEKQSFRARGK